ncbi:MAG: CHAT domain-containing protein, partial [Bradyrhizobium sp.]|nr:CHAT domain-containing protein [Bradyrhizobium sp.]
MREAIEVGNSSTGSSFCTNLRLLFVLIVSFIMLPSIVSASAQTTPDADRENVVAMPIENAQNASLADTLPAAFLPPPRSIADIASVLDNEKPDLKKIDGLKARADASPGAETGADLAHFYFERARARSELGRLHQAVDDGKKAVEIGKGVVSANVMGRFLQFLSQEYAATGDPQRGLEINQRQLAGANVAGAKGFALGANVKIAQILIQMGDIEQADAYIHRSDALIQEARTSQEPGWRSAYAIKGQDWESMVEGGHAIIFEARGQFSEAEKAYRVQEIRKFASIKSILQLDNAPSETLMRQGVDYAVLNQARMKARQGRLAEAEVDARRALLSRLKDVGKYNPVTINFISGFASILVEEGRYAEAEKLTRVALEINRTIGVADDTVSSVQLLSQLGSTLIIQRKYSEASAVYVDLDKAIANWEPRQRERFQIGESRIISLYNSGRVEAGIAAAERLVKRSAEHFGENHADTASARGILAVGLMRAKRDADAIREFRTAIPLLLAQSRENANDDDAGVMAARSQQLQDAVEAYITILAGRADASNDQLGAETFALADAIRGRSVQQALAASSARSSAQDPELAELVRKEQDLSKQLNAQLGTLNNLLSLSSAERNEKNVAALNASINALRAERSKARLDINQKFPAYADLVSPKPPSVEEIKVTLADNEAMLSFYFGRGGSFVWAIPKNGPVAFAAIAATGADVDTRVRNLRAALEPQAATISDIPPFDLKLGYELYSLLLKPVESGWKHAKSLVVVTNGALGLLPLSLLPTAPAEANTSDEPLFASYSAVPWLARSHAVTTVPSAAALRTLRQLPPGKPGRGELIAFGDPLFSAEQAAEDVAPKVIAVAEAGSATTRGIPLKRRSSPKLEGVDSAELAMLPRLPDTADELRSIALALQADPSKVLKLGKDANEDTVKTMELSGFKVLAFATHGLVPGELDGLTQPALALTSPVVAGVGGDGLLTMEEILQLKLNADWVVLSACNTGAGEGAGAEAASGLGRAFFYAGTRAILVTNWSVHSVSARELIADLFKRQADDSRLTRGEALRQAMMELMDGPGYVG